MTREEAIRIIDLRSTCRECVVSGFDCDDCDIAFEMAIEALKQPELVRCKDCKNGVALITADGRKLFDCDNTTGFHDGDWFCADGERKEG